MEKIKLDPWLILAIVILLIGALYGFHRYYRNVKLRAAELRDEIQNNLHQLGIEIERQELLIKQAVRVYKWTSLTLFTLLFCTLALAIVLGMTYNEALENVIGTTGLILAMITVIFYETLNPDVLLKKLKERVLIWVFRRNDFDPDLVTRLKKRVKQKEAELRELQTAQRIS